jgi:hypothetical protein
MNGLAGCRSISSSAYSIAGLSLTAAGTASAFDAQEPKAADLSQKRSVSVEVAACRRRSALLGGQSEIHPAARRMAAGRYSAVRNATSQENSRDFEIVLRLIKSWDKIPQSL